MKAFILFFALALVSNARSQTCSQRAATSTTIVEFLRPSRSTVCREWTIGSTDGAQQKYEVYFARSYISCSSGSNIKVLNQARTELYSYCSTRSRTFETTQDNLIIQFTNGRGYLYSAIFWRASASSTPVTGGPVTNAPPPTGATPPAGSNPNYKCGVPINPISNNGQRIINGAVANPHSFPWQAFVTSASSRNSFVCGGTLLNNQWVVTAAHCVDSSNGQFAVYLGSHQMPLSSPNGQRINIARTILHENWNSRSLTNDIALLKLSTPVTFNDNIIPACLPTRSTAVGSNGWVTGWGVTRDNGNVASLLNQVGVQVRDLDVCRSVSIRSSGQLCVGDPAYLNNGRPQDSCQGDSGGPFITNEGNNWVLSGIVSYGGSSCDGRGVYTDVYSYLSWINNNMASN